VVVRQVLLRVPAAVVQEFARLLQSVPPEAEIRLPDAVSASAVE